ncbi:MAG: response regulator [Roseburia sp.]
MEKSMTAKEQEIVKDVVKSEFDLITYVDVQTGDYNSIITSARAAAVSRIRGIYSEMNDSMIPRYVHPEDQETCAAQLALNHICKELERRDHIVVSYRLLCEGEYRRKELRIYYHGGDAGTLVMVRRDVTESYEEHRRQKERLYRALMDARHANQEKNEFLERMSHEIRIPMNSVIGLSYLTRELADNGEQVFENLDKINRSSRFMLSFLDDILNLSQLESGNVALIQTDTDFQKFLSDIGGEAERAAHEQQLRFSMEQRGLFCPRYRFDAEKLKKALMNILMNAVKFNCADGSVDFIVEWLAESGAETVVRFEIRDTGIGMDVSFLPYAFTPFEREDGGNPTLNGGGGLGLAIAKNIIEFMDGRIDLYSEKGRGSTIVVTMSLKKSEDFETRAHKKKKPAEWDYDFAGKRILIVEDNETNMEITRNILRHKHFEVEVAQDGARGVERFLEHEPGYYDAILMDIHMPVMDGLDATKQIRSAGRADSRQIPIIAMTANVFEKDVRKSLEAGMNAHLSKPMNIGQMYEILDNMLYR